MNFDNALMREDGKLHNFTIKIDGKYFKCECGCNVFHKPDKTYLDLYMCNSCGNKFTPYY